LNGRRIYLSTTIYYVKKNMKILRERQERERIAHPGRLMGKGSVLPKDGCTVGKPGHCGRPYILLLIVSW
jgi:hypothetical protein